MATPCPCCKNQIIRCVIISGTKWGYAECSKCYVGGPSVRISEDWTREAIREWNERWKRNQ
jgi:hypothetical protein